MQPRISVITLAVDDLERALVFYRDGLGLDSPGVVGTEFPGEGIPDRSRHDDTSGLRDAFEARGNVDRCTE